MVAGSGKAAARAASDKAFEMLLGRLLRSGVILAAAVVFVGGVWYLVQSKSEVENYKIFRGEPAELTHAAQIVRQAGSSNPLGLIQLGLLLLIATPVARVVFSVAGFAIERDWMYVVITLLVLLTLLYSLASSSLAARP
ncbi:MAG TPA: DUF1634 domain-containing protein [Methylomirabilota bacterium]|nr:DUF1634 domain-containing protein [Methylomirabilota bacterium]